MRTYRPCSSDTNGTSTSLFPMAFVTSKVPTVVVKVVESLTWILTLVTYCEFVLARPEMITPEIGLLVPKSICIHCPTEFDPADQPWEEERALRA